MNSKRNLLYVVHRVPYPPDRGDRIRSFHLLKFLAERANVWLATLSDEPLHPDCLPELNRLCKVVRVESVSKLRYLRGAFSLAKGRSATEGMFASSVLKKTISEWCQTVSFDAAIGFCSSVAPYLDLPELRNVPKVIDLVDVDSEKFFQYADNATGLKKHLYRLEANRVRNLEVELGKRCRGITLVTEPEVEIYRSFAPDANVQSATNGIDLDYYQSDEPEGLSSNQPTCLFVGALNYPPNIEGIRWFSKNVWPSVKQQSTNAELLIVGRNPVPEVKELARLDGVSVLANVPDVRPYYQKAHVAIAPLHIARGIQNKVLEALAMRRAVLATPAAIEGIDLDQNLVTVASSAEEWSHALLKLFENESQRTTMVEAAFQYVEDRHSWDHCLQPFADLLQI